MAESGDYVFFGHPTNSSTYAAANFEDATDTSAQYFLEGVRNSGEVQDIVSQSLNHHINEVNAARPPLGSSNWRKRLREIMLVQTESVLEFLLRPSTEHSVLSPIETVLRKYSLRNEVDRSTIKTLQELLQTNESPGVTIDREVSECLSKFGTSSLTELRAQVSGLIDLYKATGEKIFELENQIKLRIEKLGKLNKQVSCIIDLQVNSATEDLVTGMEKYLGAAVDDLGIEEMYKELVLMYSKHIALRDAIQVFKTGSCLPSEPVCSICLTDTISYAIVSCGHTFCTGCSRKMVHECGICRGKIKERMKIYIS
jgi:hypothetical protein